MQSTELVVWSAMLGGLATLAAFTLSEALAWRSAACARACAFVVLTGTACMLLTGWVQALFPAASPLLLHTLQNSLGPLSAALSLHYLSPWMGAATKDRAVGIAVKLGCLGLVLATGAMAAWTVLSPPSAWHDVLQVTALINGVALVLPIAASVRALSLGNRLAKALFASHMLLVCTVAGLYARALDMDLGIEIWLLTAICTVAFFMLSTYLGLRGERINRRLERLAGLAQNNDPATGLPRGSVLLSKADDAFWRCARKNQACTVICLHIRNLYELAETAGHNVDKQILAALAVRLRRAVGFRHIVGLYHPRCFVVVLSAANDTVLLEKALMRLHYQVAKPMSVIGQRHASHTFTPRFGIGTVSVAAGNAEVDATRVIDDAERQAVTADPGKLPFVNSPAQASP